MNASQCGAFTHQCVAYEVRILGLQFPGLCVMNACVYLGLHGSGEEKEEWYDTLGNVHSSQTCKLEEVSSLTDICDGYKDLVSYSYM